MPATPTSSLSPSSSAAPCPREVVDTWRTGSDSQASGAGSSLPLQWLSGDIDGNCLNDLPSIRAHEGSPAAP